MLILYIPYVVANGSESYCTYGDAKFKLYSFDKSSDEHNFLLTLQDP